MDILSDAVERKQSFGLALGRRWVPEALRCLRLRLYVDGVLLVDELVLLSVRNVEVGVILVLLYQLYDLLGVGNRVIFSFLLIRLTRGGRLLRVVKKLELVLLEVLAALF